MKVAFFHQTAVKHAFHHHMVVKVLFQAEHDAVFLGEEQVEYAGLITGSDQHFHEEFVDFLGGCQIDGSVAHQHAAEGRDGITRQGCQISFLYCRTASDTAGIVVFKDGESRVVELADEIQTSLEVKQVVVRQFLAV